MAKAKGRAHLFKDDEEIVKDYDPEYNGPEKDQDQSGSEVSDNEHAETEHYVSVGESKLRRKDGQSLGPQYRGSRVSRKALEQESEDEDEDEDASEDEGDYADPDLANLEADEAEANDSEISSDDALGESDAERFKDFSFRGSSKPAKKSKRATAADFMSASDSEGEGEGAELVDDEDEDSEDDMDDGLDDLVNGGTDSEEGSEDDSEAEDDDEEASEDDGSEEEESEDGKKSKAKEDAKPMLGALSNRADIDKGMAIRQQRQVYDGLLNLRIRLQKALIAANTFTALEESSEAESEPYEAAEEAAIKLLNTISSLRDGFAPAARIGDKRKRSLEVSMPSEEIWQQLQDEDGNLAKFREDRLEKWSKKVQSVTVTAARGLGAKNKTLLDALQDQLADPENRLIKRSRVPRSCAPAQTAKKITEDENIYDDADFYQLLLKELVDQRTVETSGDQNGALPSIMVTAAKEAKVRKVVDRKASKGRKMRFTVHEKLQNFMAPEDKRSWEQEQINRFFGTLFGQKMELNEESEDEDMDDVNAEEEGLRLFRN